MANKNHIPEVDIVVDEQAGVIREVQPEARFRSKKGHERRVNATIYTVLVVMSIIWLCPFVFLVLQSFRGESGGQVAYVLPRQWTLDNYRFLFAGAVFSLKALVQDLPAVIWTVLTNAAGIAGMVAFLRRKPKNPFEEKQSNLKSALMVFAVLLVINVMRCVDSTNCDFVRWFMNTLTIALFCAVIQTMMVLSVSYSLSRMRFKGRRLLMNVVLTLGMFPGFLTMIVLYYLLKMMGLTQAGAVPGLILISCASSGMGYYISKGFFDTIPKSLDESARIDGATRFQVFLKIIMPMAKPIVIYTILMAFMAPWGDYVFASYVAFGHKASYNVAVGLYRWVNTNDYQGYFTRFCAGGVLVAIPITALFMALQKYYVEGVTGGAVKG
ncbi:MAG: ABC transporter permease subunit [Clostridia bacterium]|nr:ABC transporter permease subunit [Clostridia bacterium]MDD6039667.1 ABC transporter permease subunit [Clostridia bacterium]